MIVSPNAQGGARETAPGGTSAAAPSRFDQLEGQRGVAALLVVLFHSYQYNRTGTAGIYPYAGRPQDVFFLGLDGMVSWFFVLSAFLLSLPYVRAVLEGRRATSARTFLARRAVRIVPLYLVAVTVVWAWRNPVLPGDWRDLVEHLTFTQVFDRERIFFTIGPAWSLAVEVQFYVVLAICGAAAARFGTRMQSRRARLVMLWSGTGALALASVTYALVAAVVLDRPKTDFHIWFSLPVKLVIFTAGIAVAVLYASRPRVLGRAATWGLRLASVLIVTAAMLTRAPTGGGDALFHALCGLGFGLLVLASVQGPQSGLWHQVLSSRVLVWLGLVSYSLYVWHEPLLLWLAGAGLLPSPSAGSFPIISVILIALGLLVSWASYWVIEYPASYLRTRIDGPQRGAAPIVYRHRG